MKTALPVTLLSLCAVLASAVQADDTWVKNPAKARVDYMLNCQGCHGPKGTDTADGSVPTMQAFVGYFLHVQGGREFLVQVPGSANAALSDEELADVLNWMLLNISPEQVPDDFTPYTTGEVTKLRGLLMSDVAATREILLGRMRKAKLVP